MLRKLTKPTKEWSVISVLFLLLPFTPVAIDSCHHGRQLPSWSMQSRILTGIDHLLEHFATVSAIFCLVVDVVVNVSKLTTTTAFTPITSYHTQSGAEREAERVPHIIRTAPHRVLRGAHLALVVVKSSALGFGALVDVVPSRETHRRERISLFCYGAAPRGKSEIPSGRPSFNPR